MTYIHLVLLNFKTQLKYTIIHNILGVEMSKFPPLAHSPLWSYHIKAFDSLEKLLSTVVQGRESTISVDIVALHYQAYGMPLHPQIW